MVFRQLEHTADLALEISAPDLGGVFAEALRGFADCVSDVGRVERVESRALAASADDLESLLVDWLGEALYLFETERFLFRSAEARVESADSGWRVEGEGMGEVFDPHRHPWKVAVKGVTFHRLEIARHEAGWRARVVFDI